MTAQSGIRISDGRSFQLLNKGLLRLLLLHLLLLHFVTQQSCLITLFVCKPWRLVPFQVKLKLFRDCLFRSDVRLTAEATAKENHQATRDACEHTALFHLVPLTATPRPQTSPLISHSFCSPW